MTVYHLDVDGKALCDGKEHWNTWSVPHLVSCPDCRRIMFEQLSTGPWELFATRNDDGSVEYIGPQGFVRACCSKKPIQDVIVTEDDEGTHWGWLGLGDTYPHYIYNNQVAVNMCMNCRMDERIANGDGKLLRLKVEWRDG